ncbi:hypothetical protein C922_04050 [Plasmodium inui San Antonio 1]|uniref:EF-hand domain-containing protein n=1 Tax=Plasmodium inui San Antonio 1 TaxID=1237626 RepID=W7A8U2_9APIC|nr:hypothetical protein C922_04050 [Plasmodium inui San Antonio 1]EUD65544.1 hypothetical protein C922_04050 [Plasmodium inui San Antonio 1]
MSETREENYKSGSKAKYPQSLMMDMSRSYMNRQDRINALNLYIQKSSYNPQLLQDDEEEEDESESETLGDIILRILSIIYPDLSPGLWFIIHFIMNLIVLCVSLSSLSEPNIHDPVAEPKYNRTFIFGSIYCCFLILGVNIASFTLIMVFHAIIQKVFLEKLLQPSALCAAFYNTVDPELVYLLWSSVQIIYWRSNMILKKGAQENENYFVLRIFGYKDQDNPFMFLNSISWLITFPILLYIVFAARLLFLSIISFVFELGFLMNAHDLLGKYLSKYGILRKFNIEWFMFMADKQENMRSLFGYELYQDEKMIRQLETNDISKNFVQDKAELLLFKNLPRNCTCCKIALNRNKKKNAMKLLVPPIFEAKNIVKTENSTIKNWLACHYVVNTAPLIFLLNNSIPLINKNSVKIGGDILFRQIIMSLKMYYQEKNDTYAFTGSAMHMSSDEFSPNRNLMTLNLNRDSNLTPQQGPIPFSPKNVVNNSDSESRAKKKINLENIFNDVDLDAIRLEAAQEEQRKEGSDGAANDATKNTPWEAVETGRETTAAPGISEPKLLVKAKSRAKQRLKAKRGSRNGSSVAQRRRGKSGVLERGEAGTRDLVEQSGERHTHGFISGSSIQKVERGTSSFVSDTIEMKKARREKQRGEALDGVTSGASPRVQHIRSLKVTDGGIQRGHPSDGEPDGEPQDGRGVNAAALRKDTVWENLQRETPNGGTGEGAAILPLAAIRGKDEMDEKGEDPNLRRKETSILEGTKFNICITPSLSGIQEMASEKKDSVAGTNGGGNALYDDLKGAEEGSFYPPLENYNSMQVQIKDFTIEDVLQKKYTTDSMHKCEMGRGPSGKGASVVQEVDNADEENDAEEPGDADEADEADEATPPDFEVENATRRLDSEHTVGAPLQNGPAKRNATLNISSDESNKDSYTREVNSSYQLFGDRKKKTNNKMKESIKLSRKMKNNGSTNKNTQYYHSRLLNEELNVLERSDAINVKKLKENKKAKLCSCLCFKKNKKGRFSRIKKDISLEIEDPFVMNVRSPMQMTINGNEFITKEMIEVFLKPEEAEEFMREFDLSGHGKIDMLMFRNAIKRAISCRKKFIKSLKGQESILKLVRRLMSILLSFLASVVLLFIFGVSVDTIIVTGAAFITAVTVILSYMYTSFITSVIFIAFSNPYNIGDRIRLDGGEAMYIKKIKTYTTEFETTTGKIVIYENSKLSNAKIYNESRSKNAYIDISFKVDINTPLLALKELRKSLQFLVDSRPSDFCKTKNLYFGYSLQPGHFYEISFWIKCVEGWGNWRKVFELRTDIYDFIILQLRLLSISYRLPTQKVGFTAPLNIMDTSNLKANRNKPYDYSCPPKEIRNPLFMPSAKHKREFDWSGEERQTGDHLREEILPRTQICLPNDGAHLRSPLAGDIPIHFFLTEGVDRPLLHRRRSRNTEQCGAGWGQNGATDQEETCIDSSGLFLPKRRSLLGNQLPYEESYTHGGGAPAQGGLTKGGNNIGVGTPPVPFWKNLKAGHPAIPMKNMSNMWDDSEDRNPKRWPHEPMDDWETHPSGDSDGVNPHCGTTFLYQQYNSEQPNHMLYPHNIFHTSERSQEIKYDEGDEYSYDSSSGYDSFEYVKHFTNLHDGVRRGLPVKGGRSLARKRDCNKKDE